MAISSGALELLEAGGPVLYILVAMSVLALAIVLLKLWQFTAARAFASGSVEAALGHWRAGRPRQALETLETKRDPLAEVLKVAMRGQLDPSQPEDRVREEVARVASVRLENLRSHQRSLEVIGSLSPLLGLLGTVIGMIEAFQNLQAAGSQVDPSILSGGIWVALLTTAAGLIVAIPVVAAFNLFERIIERLRHRIEDAATQIFTQPLSVSGENRKAA